MPSKRSTSSSSKKSNDALTLLKADHDKVKKMFKEFERLNNDESDEECEQLAKQICNELKIHTTIEEEIFYPEARSAIEDDDLLDEAEVEHASAKELIEQIESTSSADEKFAAKVSVLGEYVNHHIKEEQDEMFPQCKKAKMDLQGIGEKLMQRKQELMSEMGMDSEEGEEAGEAATGGARRSSSRGGQASRAGR
ncbi:MAG: Hemerythrin cation binding region [Betaproteobacteria bacterium]|nr:Hemerythrin cation binding region [Betaproteobacteria bacterium]